MYFKLWELHGWNKRFAARPKLNCSEFPQVHAVDLTPGAAAFLSAAAYAGERIPEFFPRYFRKVSAFLAENWLLAAKLNRTLPPNPEFIC